MEFFKLLFLASIYCGIVLADPVTPDKVFSNDEIEIINLERNFFLRNDDHSDLPIWRFTNRKYGSHFLNNRTIYFSLEEVAEHILQDGFPIQRRLQELFRAETGVHSRIGEILPHLSLNLGLMGQGFFGAFNGLFSFLSPTNWIKLANQEILAHVTKKLLFKNIMDEVLHAKLAYLSQHQLITDFEIINFYLIHLQLLADLWQNNDDDILALKAEFSVIGTDMASKRGDVKLGFDDLALIIALEEINDENGISTFNIDLMNNFPSAVEDTSKIPLLYKDKEQFLQHVVKRSIELEIVNDFYDISKLNIGLSAFGNISNIGMDNTNNGLELALNLGYGTLPNILIANSMRRTAKIDVQNEFINVLDNARRSFDLYTNSLGGFTEAKRSIVIVRESLKNQLQKILTEQKIPDANFLLTIRQLMQAELKLNNALHGSLKALANVNRYLFVDDLGIANLLPDDDIILENYSSSLAHVLNSEKQLKKLKSFFSNVTCAQTLKHFFQKKSIKNYKYVFTKEEINEEIQKNISKILHKNKTLKCQDFYTELASWINTNNIIIQDHDFIFLNNKTK